MKNKFGIYRIKNTINRKIYIGSAINFRKRFNFHRYQLNNNKHHSLYLQRAWNKQSSGDFIFEIIDIVDDKDELLSIEQAYLDFFDPEYNICRFAGSPLGRKCSEETKLKISKIHKGKKVSGETRQKISKSGLGRKHKKKTLEKISRARRNQVGELSPGSKLNNPQVRVIKWLLENTSIYQKEIAEIFGVIRQTITAIKTGKTWSHI